jgi:hypothetical protein
VTDADDVLLDDRACVELLGGVWAVAPMSLTPRFFARS